jgi:hypothetical protein
LGNQPFFYSSPLFVDQLHIIGAKSEKFHQIPNKKPAQINRGRPNINNKSDDPKIKKNKKNLGGQKPAGHFGKKDFIKTKIGKIHD